jgi:uncharacterized RDD family membrane protein YckC
MELDDRLTITTPEGVELDLELAGLGSRFMGQLLDFTIKVISILAIGLTLSAAGLTGLAIMLPLIFLILYAYDVVFETFASGRTPGKMATRLRVVRIGGEPIDFMSSAIRNVLRLIDGAPLMYVPGIISILATKRHQRLGDLAAGTIVVREEPAQVELQPGLGPPGAAPGGGWGQPRGGEPSWGQPSWEAPAGASSPPPPPPPPPFSGPVWDVSQVSAGEIGAVRSFLERRWELDYVARAQLAMQLAEALWPKVAGATPGLPPEQFLEQLAFQKGQRA